MKAHQKRGRVEEALQFGGITVVIDEAHYCFDSYIRPCTLPGRINWILTALANRGVPVVMIATHQFGKAVARVERSTGWSSEQLRGRIAYTEQLPDTLPMSDLIAVARTGFPEGDACAWRALAAYADLSDTHLAAITALVSRARWHASQAGRPAATNDDLRHALREVSQPQKNSASPPMRKSRAPASVASARHHEVAVIQRRRAHPHQNLASARLRFGELIQLQ